MILDIVPLTSTDEALLFLKRYEESSQFLINNLREYGPKVGEYPYSGNFKIIKEKNQVVGVFCLAKCGNLYAQANHANYTEFILESCKREPFPVKGFLGPWDILSPLFECYKIENPSFKPSFQSKEILYRLPLEPKDIRFSHHQEVRLLVRNDFSDWLPLRTAYMKELGLTSDMAPDQVKIRFEKSTQNKIWWGLFRGGELCSIAGLNSKGENIGQVGGVFTPKPKRQLGLSKATMLHMLKDCRDLHGHTKSILFTGETDIPAQNLYESIGYDRIGHFALILS